MQSFTLKEKTNLKEGLSEQQAASREKNTVARSSKSIGRIVFEHTFTFFNLINFVLAGLVIFTGQIRNLLFMIVVVSNLFIGLFQEIRSRKVLNKLSLMHQQQYFVLRSGKWKQVDMDQIVLGDLVRLQLGDQIPCDGVAVQGECEVNESLLTGESDAQDKKDGSSLYSGCFLTRGLCIMQTCAVGQQTIMNQILQQAKRHSRYPSQLRDALDAILRFCTWILIPLGILLFLRLFFVNHQPLNDSILSIVASMVGMIPEGLIILTSIALASASVRLARQNVLIQELYCIENLARVDVLCLDKTGTITTGHMKVNRFVPLESSEQQLKQELSDLYGSLEDENLTSAAIRQALKDVPAAEKADRLFPFDSTAKCTGAVFGNQTLICGAYPFVVSKTDPQIEKQISSYADEGCRVLVLARAPWLEKLEKGDYPILGLIVIEDEIRPDAPEILQYFEKQDVQIKIISGDMAQTVQSIAERAGVQGKTIDMSTIPDDGIEQAVLSGTIFGRVSPFQKQKMIEALQKNGHTAAMTGDGANDVMALKQADCSIAMGSGTQAARSVSSMVLLEDQFDALPGILGQGRQVINNIQRTASLFLVKTIFSMLLTLCTLIFMDAYPFLPVQLTLISSLGTGIPAFILTFEKNQARVQGSFLVNVLGRAIPGAAALTAGLICLDILHSIGILPVSAEVFHTLCTLLGAVNALAVLYRICMPLTPARNILILAMAAGFVLSFLFLPGVFSLVPLTLYQLAVCAADAAGMVLLFLFLLGIRWDRILDHIPALKTERSARFHIHRKKTAER